MTPLPRWAAPVMILVALALGPWTLYLTYTLPAHHLTRHWDVAWVGFDIALLVAFAVTAGCVIRHSRWLIPAATVTGTMLLCDAWFDVVTATDGAEKMDAILSACLAELPLAALCGLLVWDASRNVLEQPETVLELGDP